MSILRCGLIVEPFFCEIGASTEFLAVGGIRGKERMWGNEYFRIDALKIRGRPHVCQCCIEPKMVPRKTAKRPRGLPKVPTRTPPFGVTLPDAVVGKPSGAARLTELAINQSESCWASKMEWRDIVQYFPNWHNFRCNGSRVVYEVGISIERYYSTFS
jgi:hypothetical protein